MWFFIYIGHTGEKPFKCPKCEYRTTTTSHLKIHALSHSGDRPHKCPFVDCHYATAQSSNLRQHISVKHENGNEGKEEGEGELYLPQGDPLSLELSSPYLMTTTIPTSLNEIKKKKSESLLTNTCQQSNLLSQNLLEPKENNSSIIPNIPSSSSTSLPFMIHTSTLEKPSLKKRNKKNDLLDSSEEEKTLVSNWFQEIFNHENKKGEPSSSSV